ncbi:GPI ethanolamine phosphate transferase 3 isoform X2 [Chiloscyllium plagiosum]|uniref:GPI ethanolamine phosphate transferase 3 isoform X2 n=1 Tax=Chiloscyllium plagiosum TaxID=36176 RepID=UPI001CB8588E|nr:GPI ethanolamine phosphate transferase 3 isoform X2 [Chiloscyllium plagiosum]
MPRIVTVLTLCWSCLLFYAGLGLFLSGFLLVRVELRSRSSCGEAPMPSAWGGRQGEGFTPDSCWMARRFSKAIVLIIDALRFDFAKYDPKNRNPKPFENKLDVIYHSVISKPEHARLFQFRADPPTTTMQRIKGMTTGTLPTFIDVGSNFASSAIQEDNLIQQLVQNEKKIVFMGDDTWEGLFPNKFFKSFPFPSFNVKDLHTVDDGILQHIHTTGVDHCGHRYGPHHPAMAEKLMQMNKMLRSLIGQLQNDTLLVVLGDHGMTNTGDHGGDSEGEVNAALFIYSTLPLLEIKPAEDSNVVSQIDLVPTLALLLGIPIPYSNIGMVMVDLFISEPKLDDNQYLEQAKALHINAIQVNRFLESYSYAARDLPVTKLKYLKELFSTAVMEYNDLITIMQKSEKIVPDQDFHTRFQNLLITQQRYLRETKEVCRESWARFNPAHMLYGIVLLAATCMHCFLVSETASTFESLYKQLLLYPVIWGLTAGLTVYFWMLISGITLEPLMICFWIAFGSHVSFHWNFWRLERKKHNHSDKLIQSSNICNQQKWKSWLKCFIPLGILLLRCLAMFSNSFVITEGQVVSFLLKSLVTFTVLKLKWNGKLTNYCLNTPFVPDIQKNSGSMSYKRESCYLIVFMMTFMVCILFSSNFYHCREEIADCEPSPFLKPLSRISNSQQKNFHYILSVSSLGALVYLIRRWFLHYGNLNSSHLVVFFIRLGFPFIVFCLCCYWAVNAASEETSIKLQDLTRKIMIIIPGIVFVLVITGFLIVLWNPITVFIKDNRESDDTLVPSYKDSMTTEVDSLHVVPLIYRKMQKAMSIHFNDNQTKTRTMAAYGLGTVYSAALITILTLLTLLLIMLHNERMSLAFLLLFLEGFSFLEIHGTTRNLSLQSNNTGYFFVPWYAVTAWAFTATQFFYATGHQPTFPAIQWNAAFVGFIEGHSTNILPALLVGMNTFASHILFAVGCPLLLLWPFVREMKSCKSKNIKKNSGDEDQVMEMRLREKPQMFSAALLQLGMRYLFVYGVQLLASVCAVAILRRHLMVWKIFAPKFLFEALGFVVTSIYLLITFCFIMRVDVAVNKWFKELLLKQSR